MDEGRREVEGRLAVVEDDPILLDQLLWALKERFEVHSARDAFEGLKLAERDPDVYLLDLRLPPSGEAEEGLRLLQAIRQRQPDATVVVMTAEAERRWAHKAIELGAFDFFRKPFEKTDLLHVLRRALERRRILAENRLLRESAFRRESYGGLLGESPGMRSLFAQIEKVTHTDATVLVTGESGTGKELVASAVHFNSSRRARPYIRVSCASLPESLIESELFGYEKGAFTGASERRLGRFEAADGGTLFLDEVGELPPSFQVKLLRVLQERQVERLGSNKPHDIDVRIVTASQRPLEEEIAVGRFREDLLFRINTVTIRIPALRERREDILLLARSFLQEFAKERGKTIEGFEGAVLELFDGYAWPGNVRELRNVVERAVLFCKGSRIAIEDVPISVRSLSSLGQKAEVIPLSKAVERAEAEAIRGALAETQGRRAEAAELLGVTRKTLWEKMRHLDLEGRIPRGDETH